MSRSSLVGILVVAAVLDVLIPIPFFAAAAIYVVVKRPPEFLAWVKKIYERKGAGN